MLSRRAAQWFVIALLFYKLYPGPRWMHWWKFGRHIVSLSCPTTHTTPFVSPRFSHLEDLFLMVYPITFEVTLLKAFSKVKAKLVRLFCHDSAKRNLQTFGFGLWKKLLRLECHSKFDRLYLQTACTSSLENSLGQKKGFWCAVFIICTFSSKNTWYVCTHTHTHAYICSYHQLQIQIQMQIPIQTKIQTTQIQIFTWPYQCSK